MAKKEQAKPEQAKPEQPVQRELKDASGNPSDLVLTRPGEESLVDIARRKEAFEQAWAAHVGSSQDSGARQAFFEDWIQTYKPT